MYSVIRTGNIRAYVPTSEEWPQTYELNVTEFEGRGGAVRVFMEKETLLDLQKQLNAIFPQSSKPSRINTVNTEDDEK